MLIHRLLLFLNRLLYPGPRTLTPGRGDDRKFHFTLISITFNNSMIPPVSWQGPQKVPPRWIDRISLFFTVFAGILATGAHLFGGVALNPVAYWSILIVALITGLFISSRRSNTE